MLKRDDVLVKVARCLRPTSFGIVALFLILATFEVGTLVPPGQSLTLQSGIMQREWEYNNVPSP